MNILFIVALIALMFTLPKSIKLSKRNKLNRKYIEVIRLLDDEEAFFNIIDTVIEETTDIEFNNKTKIVKLFALTYHNRYQGVKALIEDINLEPLLYTNNNMDRQKMVYNEDSFYYLLIAIILKACSDKQQECIELMNNLIENNKAELEQLLVYDIYQEILNFYNNKDGAGEYLKKLQAGEYGGLYSKQVIGINKMTGDLLLVAFTKDEEAIENSKNYQNTIMKTRIARWLQIEEIVKEEKLEEEKDEENTD